MFLKIFLVLNFIFLYINCVYIYIDSTEKKCVSTYRFSHSTLIIFFSISGEVEFDNLITIEDPTHFEMYIARDSYQRKITFPIDQEGKYYFCIENFSKSQIKVNVLFQDENFKRMSTEIKNIEDFIQGISDLTNKLQVISFNIKNNIIRRQIHFLIAQHLRDEINLISLFKIIFVVFISGIELRMISIILTNVKVVKRVNPDNENQPLKQGELKYGNNDI